MNCSKCGKEMTDSNGTTVIGLDITIDFSMRDRQLEEFARKQLGKYELNKRYCLCYECYLNSFFSK